MHLPIRKDYYGEPMHHPGVSNLVAQLIVLGYVYTIHHSATTVKIYMDFPCITVYPFTLTREPINRYLASKDAVVAEAPLRQGLALSK